MFRNNLFHVWFGIVILSCMFLIGQESWVPTQPDCSLNGLCDPRCAAGADPDCAPPWPILNTDKDILSLFAEVTESIGVEAVDPDGNPDSFTVISDDTCVIVTEDEVDRVLDISVPSATEPCTQPVTINSGSGLTKDITIKVIDPMVMDIGNGLLIRFTNDYDDSYPTHWFMYTTTYHTLDQATCKAEPYDGFEASGIRFHADAPACCAEGIVPSCTNPPQWKKYPTVLLKDTSGQELIKDIDGVDEDSDNPGYADDVVTPIWSLDSGGSCLHVYNPDCPTGYVALSQVLCNCPGPITHECPARPDPPWDNDCDCRFPMCVKKEHTLPGSKGREIYEHPNRLPDGRVYEISIPEDVQIPEGYAPLPLGNTVFCGEGYDNPICPDGETGPMNVLRIPIETVDHHSIPKGDTSFHLETYGEPNDFNSYIFPLNRPFFGAKVRVPFTFIESQRTCDTNCIDENVNLYPFWSLGRIERYRETFWYNNIQNSAEHVESITECSGWHEELSTSFESSIGLSVSYSAGCGLKVFNSEWKVSLSAEFLWGEDHSMSWDHNVCKTSTTTCPGNSVCQELQMTTDFVVEPLQCFIDNLGCHKRTTLSEDFIQDRDTGRENRYILLRYPRN